jgi:small GTP-binding protein
MARNRPAAARPMQYAGAGNPGQPVRFEAPQAMPGSVSATMAQAAPLPEGFDAEAFTRQAKVNFLRMQAANDAGNLDDIREFTTPEMYAEIKLDIDERKGATQRTEVTLLDADVLDATEEGNRHLVSVRFHGMLKEDSETAEAFDEIWHLTKPAQGKGGWLVAGAAHLRHHLPPGRGQDHADGKAAAVRRRHPDGRHGEGAQERRHATSDWMEVEKQRGISVTSSVMQFDYGGHTINLLDTPGHQDFSEDTYRVLTAVDAAVMVIDAAKGVEAQTIKLLEVCRLRNTPIITFVNKMDREVREPMELLEEIESVLKIDCAPITWPLGMGKPSAASGTCCTSELMRFKPGEENAGGEFELIEGDRQPEARRTLPAGDRPPARGRRADRRAPATPSTSPPSSPAGRARCSSAPASTTSACARSCRRWSTGRRRRSRATAAAAWCEPAEAPFTGFVFKIQANMDPKHRDRIAFFRVCSGRYTPGMKVSHRGRRRR